MKASQVLSGKRAVHRVRFPFSCFGASLLPDAPEFAERKKAEREAWAAEHPGEAEPEPVWVGFRLLTGLEAGAILEGAREYAKGRGIEDPKPGNELYELGKAIHTLAVACVDADAPDEPFFDGGVQQIQASPELGRDGILALAEQHEAYQDACNAELLKLSPEEVWAAVKELAGPNGLPFCERLRPGLRATLLRSMAVLLLDFWTAKFTPGGAAEASTSEPKTTQPSADDAPAVEA